MMEQNAASHANANWLRSRWKTENLPYQPRNNHTDRECQNTIGNLETEASRTPLAQPVPEPESPARPQTGPSPHESSSRRRRDPPEGTGSSLEERQRKGTQGGEGGLNELSIPAPSDLPHERKDSYEFAEHKARDTNRTGQSQDDQAFLSEVAAPTLVDPVTHYRSGIRDRNTESESPSVHSGENKSEEELSPVSPTATYLYTISYLILFSILGTLARLGVEAITRYPQAPFPSVVLWANVGGSLFMGFLAEDRRLFRQEWGMKSKKWSFHGLGKSIPVGAEVVQKANANHVKVKKTIPLYIGLATGFCGSFTSFSSFIRDAFLALTNDLASPSITSPFNTSTHPGPRSGGYSFEATIATLMIQVACSISALYFGAHLALLLEPVTPTLPFAAIRHILDPLTVFLAIGCWLGALLLSIFPPEDFWRGRVTLALVLAPPGCLLRYYASKHLNARVPSFPLGTFFVNILGTVVLGMCYDLQHARSIGAAPGGRAAACQVFQGVMEGFCGCTTTVSTWVAELTSLRRRHAYIYGIASMAIALALLVVVMGSVGWTIGFGTPLCSV